MSARLHPSQIRDPVRQRNAEQASAKRILETTRQREVLTVQLHAAREAILTAWQDLGWMALYRFVQHELGLPVPKRLLHTWLVAQPEHQGIVEAKQRKNAANYRHHLNVHFHRASRCIPAVRVTNWDHVLSRLQAYFARPVSSRMPWLVPLGDEEALLASFTVRMCGVEERDTFHPRPLDLPSPPTEEP